MRRPRRNHTAAFKAKVAVAALKDLIGVIQFGLIGAAIVWSSRTLLDMIILVIFAKKALRA